MKATSRLSGGFTLIEMLISLTLLVFVVMALASFLVSNSRLNKSQTMALATQANARNCMAMIQAAMRSAGWDPMNAGISAVALDPTPTGADNYLQVFADLNGDTDTADADEDVTVRHHASTIEWKKSAGGSYVVLSEDITNDANQDGTIEPMFTPDSTTAPKQVTVKITARSPAPDSRTGRYFVYTVTSDVVLRGRL